MMTYDDFHELCRQRRSVRYFSDTPVSREEIEKVLEAARLAPSIQNMQPWHFHVVFSKELRHKLTQSSIYGNFVEGAGAFIVVSATLSMTDPNDDMIWNPKELEYSCVAAIEQLLLAATSIGLGGTWVSLHHGEPHHLLNLKPAEVVVGGILLGHLKPGEEEASGEHERKPVDQIVTYHE